MDMRARGIHDDFFQKYFRAWADHPEYAPDYFGFLRMVLPIYKDEKPNLGAIAQLDSEARKRNEKILFTVEDAARDFCIFYDKFFTNPLAQDLGKGGEGKTLSKYFELEELDKVPDVRVYGRNKVDQAEHEIAVALLQRLRMITPKRILDGIKSTLDKHYDKGLAAASSENSYNHKSEYVHISAHRSGGPDKATTTFLRPSRNYGGVIKEGYEGVYYPRYYVLVKS